MKNLKLYHLDFARPVETVVWEYSLLPENDRIQMANLFFEASFDYQDKMNTYNFLFITDSSQMTKYIDILQSNMVLHFVHDWTEPMLKDKLHIENIEKNLDSTSLKIWDKFKTKLDEWLLLNQQLDNVLDIILEKGVEKLRDSDKKFLENYAK